MATRLRLPPLTSIVLDPAEGESLQRQVYHRIRDLIAGRQVRTGARLPSTRALASELRISRNTVMAAFDRLTAEGYIEVRRGAGSYVTRIRPDDTMAVGGSEVPAAMRRPRARPTPPFQVGVPPIEIFPVRVWERLLVAAWRRSSRRVLGAADPGGCPELREAVATHLRHARGVRCSADQVLIVPGSQQALDLVARVLIRRGDAVWLEEPGYTGARLAFAAAGAHLVPVPVDAHGLDVAAGVQRAPAPRCVYLTPASHFPTAAVLSPDRRAAIMRLAGTVAGGTYIVEDDHAAAFRYAGRPLPALQRGDDAGRVIYVGSFSLVIGPALGLGYLIVPRALRDEFAAAQQVAGARAGALEQMVLASFIEEGYFAAHLRRLRAASAERQEVLLDAMRSFLGGALRATRVDAGTHVIADIDPRLALDDVALAERAAGDGIVLLPLSALHLEPTARRAVLLGFSGYGPSQIRRSIRTLATLCRRTDAPRGWLSVSA